MTVQEVCRAVMKETKTSQAMVAEKAGWGGQNNVSMFLKSKSMRVEAFVAIMSACGYEVVARSTDGTHPEYVVGDAAGNRGGGIDEAKLEEMIRKAVADALAERDGGTPGQK